jgi:hypothetical protein
VYGNDPRVHRRRRSRSQRRPALAGPRTASGQGPQAHAHRRRHRGRGRRDGRRGRPRRALDASTGRAADGRHHVALHLRPRQGRADRPHARHRPARARPPRRTARRMARPARARGAREPRPHSPPPVDARDRHLPPPDGPRRDRQVRLRAARPRGRRPHRRRDGLGAHASARVRPGVATRVGTAATEAYRGLWDPDHTFEFGLQRVLDGIEALVGTRRAGGSRARTAGSSRRTARRRPR